MNKSKNNLKFLSKSVLLEESGLPRINTYTILAITSIIVLFLVWSNFMTINDTVSVSGYAVKSELEDSNYTYVYRVPSRNITLIKAGQKLQMTIPGITVKETIKSSISHISREPVVDNQGRTYYEIQITPQIDSSYRGELNSTLMNGMEINGEIIVGSRTLLQYFLGPLWDVGQKAFGSK